jgi:hypothetical protein
MVYFFNVNAEKKSIKTILVTKKTALNFNSSGISIVEKVTISAESKPENEPNTHFPLLLVSLAVSTVSFSLFSA